MVPVHIKAFQCAPGRMLGPMLFFICINGYWQDLEIGCIPMTPTMQKFTQHKQPVGSTDGNAYTNQITAEVKTSGLSRCKILFHIQMLSYFLTCFFSPNFFWSWCTASSNVLIFLLWSSSPRLRFSLLSLSSECLSLCLRSSTSARTLLSAAISCNSRGGKWLDAQIALSKDLFLGIKLKGVFVRNVDFGITPNTVSNFLCILHFFPKAALRYSIFETISLI